MSVVTVVVPCYNMANSIGDTIMSVRKQIFLNWRLIVVDDGSTDGSFDRIMAAFEDDYRCTAIKQENSGVAAARNAAISQANPGLILPLDADDKLAPRALFEFIFAAARNTDADLFVPWVHHVSPEKDWIVRRQYKGYEALLKQNSLPNSCMYTKSGWEKAGGYRSGTMYEDWEFWIRLLGPESKVVSVPIPLIEYAVRPDSRLHEAMKRHREEVDIIKRLNPEKYGLA